MTSVLLLALALGAQQDPTSAGRRAAEAAELVRQLGQFPAAIDGRIKSDTGQRMPQEQQRETIYERLRALGPAAVPALLRGMAHPDVQTRRNVALYLGYERGNSARHAPELLDVRPYLSRLTRGLDDDDQRVKE